MANLKHSEAIISNPITNATATGDEILALSVETSPGSGTYVDGAILISELKLYVEAP